MYNINEWSPPLTPTTPVTPFYSESTYSDNPYIIAPPPPPLKKSRRSFIMVFFLILMVLFMLFGTSVFFYLAGKQASEQVRAIPTTLPTITSTTQPYTAQDILNDMIAHNLTVVGSDYGESLTYFFADPLYSNVVRVPFQSSVIWSVWSGQTPGSCPDACVGLWVYGSESIALEVKHNLTEDGTMAQQTPAQGPTAYPDVTQHGRCIAQGVKGTAYEGVILTYCE